MLKEKGFYKGINFGGWLSQCDYSDERLNGFIKEEDFKKAASWGIDHIRVPFDYNIIENEEGTEYKEEGFARLARAAELARKYGLNIVLDLHKTAGFSFDSYSENEHGFFEDEKYQQRFYRLWEQMAKRFGSDSEHIAFELLNEVTDDKYIEVWNKVIKNCISIIRKYAPDTIILVGSYWNNHASAVKALESPYDDKVVYNFHSYDPLEFTHQGAPWVQNEDFDVNRRISFEESGVDAAFFEGQFISAIEKAKAEGAELYCGEYGVIDRAAPEDVVKWFRTINGVFEKYGISRSAWTYKEMDFGFTDTRLDGVREELVKYL